MKTIRFLTLAAAGLATCSFAWAACWNPTNAASADATFTGPRFTHLRGAAQTADSIVRENPVLRDMPDVRGRIRWDVGYLGNDPQPRSLTLVSGLYWKQAWTGNACGIIPEADRVPPAGALTLNIHVNSAHFLSGHFFIEGSRPAAYRQPDVLGHFGKYNFYGYAADYPKEMHPGIYDGTLMLSAGGRLPWKAVTYAEYLDMVERKLRKTYGDASKNAQSSAPGVPDEKKIQAMYESMKRFNAADAEKMREKMLALLAESRDPNSKMSQNRARAASAPLANFEAELGKINRLRDTLGAEGLQRQARAGTGPTDYPMGVATPDDPRAIPLVQEDSGFWDPRDKDRVQLITVNIYGLAGEKTIGEALGAMQLERLEGLLR
jgi:hypothetical protein